MRSINRKVLSKGLINFKLGQQTLRDLLHNAEVKLVITSLTMCLLP